jgi:hypothetical protein
MELYPSIMKLAPLVLLKLLAMGAFARREQDESRYGRIALAGDVTLVISVIAGAFVAALVVGDVTPSTTATRWIVVLSGCLSLMLLAVQMLRGIASLYKDRPEASGLATPSGAASDSQGQAE